MGPHDNAKSDPEEFCSAVLGSLQELFPQDVADQLSDRRFSINVEAFDRPSAYTGIIG